MIPVCRSTGRHVVDTHALIWYLSDDTRLPITILFAAHGSLMIFMVENQDNG